jgi:hypothetical protein
MARRSRCTCLKQSSADAQLKTDLFDKSEIVLIEDGAWVLAPCAQRPSHAAPLHNWHNQQAADGVPIEVGDERGVGPEPQRGRGHGRHEDGLAAVQDLGGKCIGASD